MKVYIYGRGLSYWDHDDDYDLSIGVSTVVKADVHLLMDPLQSYKDCKVADKTEFDWYKENVRKLYCADVDWYIQALRDEIPVEKVSYNTKVQDKKLFTMVGLKEDWKEDVEKSYYPVGYVGAFPACFLAYQLGASDIVLWGVDMGLDYYTLDNPKRKAMLDLFAQLRVEFDLLQISLMVGNDKSILKEVLPIYKQS